MPALKDRVFCEVALREGKIQAEKLDHALKAQSELEAFGISKFLGAVLVEKGLASKEDVSALAETLQNFIVRCPSCQKSTSLTECDRHGHLKCGNCHQPVSLPEGRISDEDLIATASPTGHRRGSKSGKKKADSAGPPHGLAAGDATEARGTAAGIESVASAVGESDRPQRRRASAVPPSEKCFSTAYSHALVQPQEITRFRIKALLGISSTGRLYRIQESGNFGALKVIDPVLCADKVIFKRWVDFMQHAQDLPRSVTLKPTQLFREGSVNYLVRPYVGPQEQTLRAWLSTRAGLNPKDVTDLTVGILTSLSVFHSMRIVHGNLKPENVILAEGAIQLTDPGVLTLYGALGADERLLRLFDACRYQAPEVLQGNEPTLASDVFSAGRVLEDMLSLPVSAEAGGSSPTDLTVHQRLKTVVQQMTAFDPAERQPSAKEVLRDIQKGGKAEGVPPPEKPKPVKSPGSPFRRRPPVKRLLSPQVLGPILLVTVVSALSLQSWLWFRARAALASPLQAEEAAQKIVSDKVDELARWTSQTRPIPVEARKRWNDTITALRGTPWEPMVLAKAEQALSTLPPPCAKEDRIAFDKAQSEAKARRWVDALETLIGCEGNDTELPHWQALRKDIRGGLYTDLRVVFIPGGSVKVRNGQQQRTIEVEPFLVDSQLAPASAFKIIGKEADDASKVTGGIDRPLAVGVSISEARKLGTSTRKKLPTLAQWLRMSEVLRSADEWGVFAAEKILDVGGPLFQWVDEVDPDNLSRAGYGYCIGGRRPGVTANLPLRRWGGYGYPDVGVRFVIELRTAKPKQN